MAFPARVLGIAYSALLSPLAGEPATQHEEGRHPDPQAQAQEHGRRTRGPAGRAARPLRYVVRRCRAVGR